MKSSPPPTPALAFSAVVGKTLARQREIANIKQGEMAVAIGLSQSAYSRVESGDTVMNLVQLRKACDRLSVTPDELLRRASQVEKQLARQGVTVVVEKPTNEAAIAIGLGLLAAILIGFR